MKTSKQLIEEEMTDKEKQERQEGEIKLPEGWLDWNTLSLDQMVEYLEEKYKFSSTGDAKCIYHLIEFYKNHKPKEEKRKYKSNVTTIVCPICHLDFTSSYPNYGECPECGTKYDWYWDGESWDPDDNYEHFVVWEIESEEEKEYKLLNRDWI